MKNEMSPDIFSTQKLKNLNKQFRPVKLVNLQTENDKAPESINLRYASPRSPDTRNTIGDPLFNRQVPQAIP